MGKEPLQKPKWDMNKPSIQRIYGETKSALQLACGRSPVFVDLLNFLNAQNFSVENITKFTSGIPKHENLLCSAIYKIPDTPFFKLKSALMAGYNQLQWRVDDGGFYAKGSDVGDGYRRGNLHALLVGPEDCPFVANDFLLGFFLLSPKTLYRDHKHLAPEIYVPLTGPSGWRFDQGAWKDHTAGSAIYNPPNLVHATRVYKTPFLALFGWSQDIGSACEVVFAGDWENIEKKLAP